jgi:hypothetical protein
VALFFLADRHLAVPLYSTTLITSRTEYPLPVPRLHARLGPLAPPVIKTRI